jgi:glycosyltransferase involved in cell wall biosynthesis
MRIGFDAKRAFLNASGLGNYSRNTLNALRKYCPGNEFILFTPEIKEGLFEGYQHFKVVSPQNLVLKKLKSLWRSLLLVTLAKRHEVDIYHGLSNELPKGIRNSGIPSVVTIHDVVFMRYPEFYKPVDRKIYFKKVKHACKSANKIIAISQQTQNDLVTFFKVPVHKVEVLYQPVSRYFLPVPIQRTFSPSIIFPTGLSWQLGHWSPGKINWLCCRQCMPQEYQFPLYLLEELLPTFPG